MTIASESVRRFNRLEGKHPALVITLNIVIAIIPLVIVAYAVIQKASTHIAVSAASSRAST